MRKIKWAAGIVATVLLGGSLVYYNFIDKAPISGVENGNVCPDFTAQTYDVAGDTFSVGDTTFTLSEQIGKVCVVNFWGTTCQPCVEELPEFNEIQETFADSVEIIALAGAQELNAESVADWLTRKQWTTLSSHGGDWAEYSIEFGYLPVDVCMQMGVQSLPRTIIVDKSGIVAHVTDMKMSYDELHAIITDLL